MSELRVTDDVPTIEDPLEGEDQILVIVGGILYICSIDDLVVAVPAVADNAVTDAKLRDSAALSVIGRSANSSGDPADIAAGTDGHVLRRSGTTLGFGTIATAGIADSAATYAKIQNVSATDKLLGRSTAGAGVVEEIACTAAGRAILDDADAAAQRATLGAAQDRRTVTAVSSSSGVLNLDLSLGDYFTITLTENVTSLTFSNAPGSGKGATVMLQITQHASSAKTFAFPSAFDWAGGSVGVISTALSAKDVLAITTFDNATAWIATLSKAHA